jgi:hypothetical protein
MPGDLVYDRKKGSGQIDRLLLQGAASGRSAKELSALTNGVVKPEEARLRVSALLEERDWLSQAQRKKLLLEDLHVLKDELFDRINRYASTDAVSPLVGVLKEIGNRLDKGDAATEIDLNRLYENQGVLMGRVVDQALSYMKGALRQQVDADLWDELVKEALINAQTEIAKYEAIEE